MKYLKQFESFKTVNENMGEKTPESVKMRCKKI